MEDSMKIKLQMLTMDYQIPWFLVECMYTNHSNLSKLVGTPIEKLAFSCFDDLYPTVHKSKVHGGTDISTLPPGGFKHLIHIFHWTRTPAGKYLGETRSLHATKKMGNFYIPSATDLKLSATVFEKHAGIDVAYNDKRLSGVMQIAPLHIFKYSFEIYRTLLNFERHYVDCGFPVTAYVACIMNLLPTKADVKLLRANGIVPSTGIDEKEVLSSLQRLKGDDVDFNNVRMPNDLNILSEKVREHHETSYSRSYAELKSRYFANPWITISVIAGILLFILTFLQTILSFIQTKYSVLSYKQQ
ncbi:UPF0481 protein At3g47200-like [Carex rostrata]